MYSDYYDSIAKVAETDQEVATQCLLSFSARGKI